MARRAGYRRGRTGRSGVVRLVVVLSLVGSALGVGSSPALGATPPVANPDIVEVAPGSSIDIDVLANDSDDGGLGSLKITQIIDPPSSGTVEIVGGGVGLKFIAPDPFTGTAFTYEIDDGVDGTAVGEVTVNVAPPTCSDIDVAPGAGGQALRDAILSANTCLGPQVITVGAGTYDRALPQISDALTIRAADPMARPVIIDTSQQASSINPVISISNAGVVVLENLVVRDAGYQPALVDVAATDLTVSGSLLEGSVNTSTSGGAGVRALRGSTVTIRDTVIVRTDGNGVFVDGGALTLQRVSISGSASNGVSVTNSSSLSITASDIFDNSTDGLFRNGVYIRATPSVSIVDTAIFGNPGFGIDAIGSITLTRGRIGVTPAGLAAGNGTGILAWPISGPVVFDGTLIAHNTQRGILKQVSGPLTLTDVTVRDNVGPGLETQGGVTTATNSAFQNNGPDCVIGQGSVVDGGGSTDSDGTCGFTTLNTAPVAVQDRIVIDEDTFFESPAPGILGNDTDVNGDPLTAILEDDVEHGTLTLEPDGGLVYTPFPDYFGSDSFTYRANDGSSSSEPAVVDITIRGLNDAPTIAAPASLETTRDTPLDFTLSVGDTDADDRPPFVADDIVPLVGLRVDAGTITVTDAPGATITGNGSQLVAVEGELAAINAALAAVVYTPGPGVTGTDTLLIAVARQRREWRRWRIRHRVDRSDHRVGAATADDHHRSGNAGLRRGRFRSRDGHDR